MPYGIRILPEKLKSLAAGTIDATYRPLVDASAVSAFASPIRFISVKNLTNGDIFISLDGIDDHDILPPLSGQVYDISANKVSEDGAAFLSKGTSVYVKDGDTVATTGSVYASVFYGKGD